MSLTSYSSVGEWRFLIKLKFTHRASLVLSAIYLCAVAAGTMPLFFSAPKGVSAIADTMLKTRQTLHEQLAGQLLYKFAPVERVFRAPETWLIAFEQRFSLSLFCNTDVVTSFSTGSPFSSATASPVHRPPLTAYGAPCEVQDIIFNELSPVTREVRWVNLLFATSYTLIAMLLTRYSPRYVLMEDP